MSQEFDISKEQEMVAFFGIMEERLVKASKFLALAIADYIIEKATDEIREGDFVTAGGAKVKGALNTGELLRSSGRIIKRGEILVGFGAAHAEKVEYGLTAAEAQVEVDYDNIREWVRNKKIGTSSQQPYIAKKILGRIHELGISPRPFFKRAVITAERDIQRIIESVAPDIKRIMETGEAETPKPSVRDEGSLIDTT